MFHLQCSYSTLRQLRLLLTVHVHAESESALYYLVSLETLGYFSDTKATIVVIAACYLPDRSLKNYDFLMEQLFL